MQNRRVPSFFLTRTMALHQGDFDGRIAPPSNMSCRLSRTSSYRGGAIRWNLSLNGSSSINSMMCSAVSVQPISFLSREKIWWCSINIHSNFRASSGGHSFSCSSPPSCRNNSIRSFCRSLTVSLGPSFAWVPTSSLANSGKGMASDSFIAWTGRNMVRVPSITGQRWENKDGSSTIKATWSSS